MGSLIVSLGEQDESLIKGRAALCSGYTVTHTGQLKRAAGLAFVLMVLVGCQTPGCKVEISSALV